VEEGAEASEAEAEVEEEQGPSLPIRTAITISKVRAQTRLELQKLTRSCRVLGREPSQ
jgi:hypothetical protein